MAGTMQDIPYRLLGGAKPTLPQTPDGFIEAAAQSEDVHRACLEFNGLTDSARLPVDVDLGIGNEWSVMLWVLPTNMEPPNTETLFEIHNLDDAGDNANLFRVDIESSGELVFRASTSGGASFKNFKIDSLESGLSGIDGWFFAGAWSQIVVTWNGSDFNMYRNGYLMNSDMTVVTDTGGTQSNTNRSISIGSKVNQTDFFTGFMHSAAYWSEALTQGAIRQIWNQGCGSTFNLNIGIEDYGPDTGYDIRTLEAWWQLGKDTTAPVIDWTNNGRDLTVADVSGQQIWSAELENINDIMITNGRDDAESDPIRPTTWGGANWSIASWIKPTSKDPFGGGDWGLGVFGYTDYNGFDTITLKNYIYIEAYQAVFGVPTSTGNWTFEVGLWDTNGSDFLGWQRSYGSDDIADMYTNGLNEWNFIVVTYDEAQSGIANIVNVYINGVEQTMNGSFGASITRDLDTTEFGAAYLQWGSVSPGAGPRFASVERAPGLYHKGGLWNATLTQAEVTALYNSGNGSAVDWIDNFGSYTSSASLEHYYRFGQDQTRYNPDGDGITANTSAGGKFAAFPDPGTVQGNSILWDWGRTTSTGWDLDGLSDIGGEPGDFPVLVEDGPV